MYFTFGNECIEPQEGDVVKHYSVTIDSEHSKLLLHSYLKMNIGAEQGGGL